MRIRHLITSAVPVLVSLLTSLTAEAQYGGPMPSAGPVYYNGSPGSGGMPGYGGMPAPAAPPQFLPHPMISPYDHMYDETYNADGTWFRNQTNGFGPFNRPRNWFFNLDYTRTKTRQLAGTVGADDVQTYAQQMDPENDDVVPDMTFYHYFDAAPAAIIPQLTNNGIRLSGGFWNPDGSGFLFNAGWIADATETFDARSAVEQTRLPLEDVLRMRRTNWREDGAPYNLNGLTDLFITENFLLAPGTVFDTVGNQIFPRAPSFGTTFDILDRTVMNLYGLPIQYGDNPFTPQQGTTVPYDLQFILQHRLTTMSSNMNWAFTPIYDRGEIKVRPVVGGRFLRINEGFGFRGATTLLSYGLNNADNDTPIVAKVFPVGDGIDQDGDGIADTVDEPGNSVTSTTTTFTPQIGPTNLIVRSYLEAAVISTMNGPEMGLHYELGDQRGLRFTGSSRVAAMVNRERINIYGDNIGDVIGVEVTPDPITGANIAKDVFDTDTTTGPSQNAFADVNTSTHISPLFEQTLNAEVPIFSHIPVLRDMWQLDDAKLNLGWTFLVVGEIADPQESVNWTSSPVFGVTPTVRPDRNTFYQNTFNVGINWNY